MEFNKMQKEIIETPAPNVVVLASAASGKTAVLVGRLQHLLNMGVPAENIVAITFTNAAAIEIMDRLNRPKGLFVGTIHSYCNYLLLSGGVATDDILDNEEFDRLFKRIKQNQQCVKLVQYLLVDEAQDCTPEQFEFLLDIVQPLRWMLVGDFRQSLYGWNGADPKMLIQISKCAGVKTFKLNQNYRNCYEILQYARSIIRTAGIDYIDDSVPMREGKGRIIDVEYDPLGLARFIKKTGEPGDWFVLTRTNEQIEVFSKYLEQQGIPFDTFKRSQLDTDQLNQKLHDNTVKLLTIHTAKGLESKYVAVIGARFYNTEEKCVSYVAATRAKDLLVWNRIPNKARARKLTQNWEG